MVTIDNLKSSISLSQAADKFGINLHNGRGDCPFCSGVKTLSVRDDSNYRCYRAGCDKRGDVIDLLVDAGKAADKKEAFRLLVPLYKGENIEVARRRVGSLTQAFRAYQQSSLSPAIEYLGNRGIERALDAYPVGYAPAPDWLQGHGFNWSEVERCGLASKKQGLEILDQHIVFPIYDSRGALVHLQGRSLRPDASWDRWLATNGFEPPIAAHVVNAHLLPKWKEEFGYVFLCEGLTDCYSLLELGLPAVATLGVQVRLLRHLKELEGMTVIAIYDNDQFPLGHNLAESYKSWTSIFPQLVSLLHASEQIQIACVMPPKRSGIKDVNDLLNHLSWDKDRFLDYCQERWRCVEEMAFFLYEEQPAQLPLLVEAVSARRNPHYINRLKDHLGSDWITAVLDHVRS